jgi:hypothetical protein
MPIPLPAINAPAGSRCLLAMLCVMVSLPAFAQTAPPAAPAHVHHHRPRHHAPRVASAPPPAMNATVSPNLPGSPAPVPNEAETPPKGPPPTQSTNINPAIMGLHYPEVGNGYIPGSSPQAMDDASAERAGGVQVTVPLKSAAPAPLPAPTNPAAP